MTIVSNVWSFVINNKWNWKLILNVNFSIFHLWHLCPRKGCCPKTLAFPRRFVILFYFFGNLFLHQHQWFQSSWVYELKNIGNPLRQTKMTLKLLRFLVIDNFLLVLNELACDDYVSTWLWGGMTQGFASATFPLHWK